MKTRAPYYIRALLDGFLLYEKFGKDAYPKPAAITYTFALPTHDEKLKSSPHNYLKTCKPLNDKSIQETERALNLWQEVALMTYIRHDKKNPQLPNIYFMCNEPPPGHNWNGITEHGMTPQFNGIKYAYNPVYVIFDENKLKKPRGFATRVHELGHPEFAHPFDNGGFRDTNFPFSQQYTWYSSLNYNDFLTRNFFPIYRFSPSAIDMNVAHFRYGKRFTRTENTIYDLTTSHAPFNTYTVETIYDCGGMNTFSAQNHTDHAVINLRNGLDDYSHVGHQYFTQSFDTTIQNVWAGRGENTIFLNAENNRVALDSESSSKSTIVTFKQDIGLDGIENFNPARGDTLLIEKSVTDKTCDTVEVKPMTQSFGTEIIIDKDNIIRFPNVDFNTFKDDTILFANTDDPRQCPAISDYMTNLSVDRFLHSTRLGYTPVVFPKEQIPENQKQAESIIHSQNKKLFFECKTDSSHAQPKANIGWYSFFKQAKEFTYSSLEWIYEFLLQPGLEYLSANQQTLLCLAAGIFFENPFELLEMGTQRMRLA